MNAAVVNWSEGGLGIYLSWWSLENSLHINFKVLLWLRVIALTTHGFWTTSPFAELAPIYFKGRACLPLQVKFKLVGVDYQVWIESKVLLHFIMRLGNCYFIGFWAWTSLANLPDVSSSLLQQFFQIYLVSRLPLTLSHSSITLRKWKNWEVGWFWLSEWNWTQWGPFLRSKVRVVVVRSHNRSYSLCCFLVHVVELLPLARRV